VGAPAERVVLLGSKSLGAGCLRLLTDLDLGRVVGVVTIDDRADARSAWDELHEVAGAASIPVHVAADRKDAERVLGELRADLVIVAGWYWILPAAVLSAAPRGYAGIHFSLLPRYRGSSPLVWALINGDEHVGLSLFQFTPGMDEGPLWGQRQVEVRDRYVDEVLADLEAEALDLLGACYADMRDGLAAPAPQPTSGATFAAARTPDDGEIDWRRPAAEVQRFVRAQSAPYPGAWTRLDGERLTIWRATASSQPWSATPGQVVAYDDRAVLVACGDGLPLRVERVALGGAEPVDGRDVLRSLRLRLPSRA
jgi:methionyl-tRNA formyltransferase